jgi:hypothetical protein
MRRRDLAWFLCVLTGCDPVTVEPPISVTDGRGDLDPPIRRAAEALDPSLDADGDGLIDMDEVAGWTLRVDQTGRPQGIETIVVTSDPNDEDSDDDGLPDGLERLSGANPNRADTDGDGLDDVDEVQRWGTSPASVDTDGDARGPTPDASAAPDVALFDAAELALEDDPLRPGSLTSAPTATSPVLADTDGDGRTDFEERLLATRSPLRAEVPRLEVRVTPGTSFGMYLITTLATSMTETQEHGDTFSIGGGVDTELFSSQSFTWGTWASNEDYVGVAVGVGADLENFGINGTLHIASETEVGSSLDMMTSFGVTGTMRMTLGQSEQTVDSLVESSSVSVTGARIALSTDVMNAGDVPFRLRDLRIGLMYSTPGSPHLRPLGTLRPVTDPPEGYVLGLGESIEMVLEDRAAEPQLVREMMHSPGRLFLAPASYEVLNAGDEEYAFVQARVSERVSTMYLDGAGSLSGRYQVATNVRRSPMGEEEGLSVAELLGLVGIPFMAEPIAVDPPLLLQQYVFEIADRRTRLHSGAAPDLGDPHPLPPGIALGTRQLAAGWIAAFVERDADVRFYENLLEARVLPGDTVSLFYTVDEDRDGLFAMEEALHGTSDTDADSDDDGLSDFYEVRVGWYVPVAGQVPRHVFSSPTLADADLDELDDRAEMFGALRVDGYAQGTDPTRADTDRDGYDDSDELGVSGFDPLVFTPRPVMPGAYCRYEDRRRRVVRTSYVGVLDADEPVVAFRVTFFDGHEERIPITPATTAELELLRDSMAAIVAPEVRGGRAMPITCRPCAGRLEACE